MNTETIQQPASVNEAESKAGFAAPSGSASPSTWWRKYRIVKDCYCGYEVQCWRIWFPFWMQGATNTHATLEKARQYATNHARGVVEYL